VAAGEMKVMKSIAALVGLVEFATALAVGQTPSIIGKRQLNGLLGLPSDMSLTALLSSENRKNIQTLLEVQQNGTLGHFMGEPQASK
jgi:hypothetical protein